MSLSKPLTYTSIIYPPPPLVFTNDMVTINSWPAAWNEAVPLISVVEVLPGVWKRKRYTIRYPPPINHMASVWFDYKGHPQGAPGWHDQRFDYIISGSRVPTITGVNPYQNSEWLYNQLRGAIPNDPVNHHMIRGTRYEPVAMDHLAKTKGWVLLDMPLIHHKNRKDYPILVVSLDRLFAGCANGTMQRKKIIVECKCPQEIKESNLTLYGPQMQLQMECVTSYLTKPEERDECVCYLYQYRDSAWSGSGAHEYRMDKVKRDPSWLTREWPVLLDFDQRVRADRLRNEITRDVYNGLNALSTKAYLEAKEKESARGAMDGWAVEKVAREVMMRTHQQAYSEHVNSMRFC